MPDPLIMVSYSGLRYSLTLWGCQTLKQSWAGQIGFPSAEKSLGVTLKTANLSTHFWEEPSNHDSNDNCLMFAFSKDVITPNSPAYFKSLTVNKQ